MQFLANFRLTLKKLCNLKNNGKYISACPDGFIGTECEKPCIYPNYGRTCQLLCNCTREFCNFTEGCLVKSTGTYTFLLTLPSPFFIMLILSSSAPPSCVFFEKNGLIGFSHLSSVSQLICSWLQRSSRMQNVGCSNPSCDRSKS